MTWQSDPEDFVFDIAEDMQDHRNEIAVFALRGVFFRTPEVTARARNGWSVSTGRPRFKDRGPGNKGTLQEGLGQIARAQPYTVLYITNPVYYITYLEYGTRRMRPYAMLSTVFNDIRVNYT